MSLLSHWVYWHWLALAVTLIILDVLVGANFLFIWCGLCAALVAVLMVIFPLSWEWQLLVFGLGIMASLVVWRQFQKDRSAHPSTLNRRGASYVGRVFTLEKPILNGRGKVKVDDSVWLIEGEDLPAGTQVRVVGVDGVVLKVVKAP